MPRHAAWSVTSSYRPHTDTLTVYEIFQSPNTYTYPTTILACIAALVAVPVYVFYWYGPTIREKSEFAQTLAGERKAGGGLIGSSAVENVGVDALDLRTRAGGEHSEDTEV